MKELCHEWMNFVTKGNPSKRNENYFLRFFYRLQNLIDQSVSSYLPCPKVDQFKDTSNLIARLSNISFRIATIYFLCS